MKRHRTTRIIRHRLGTPDEVNNLSEVFNSYYADELGLYLVGGVLNMTLFIYEWPKLKEDYDRMLDIGEEIIYTLLDE